MPRSAYPTDGNDEITLLGNADAALRRAKAEGRGSFRYFDANMDARQRERVALQRDLRSVLKEGALVVYYRPLAQIRGDTFGFEALVRWRHPTQGLAFAGNIHSSGRRMWSDLRHRQLGVAGGVPRSRILEMSPSDRGQYIPTSVPISFPCLVWSPRFLPRPDWSPSGSNLKSLRALSSATRLRPGDFAPGWSPQFRRTATC